MLFDIVHYVSLLMFYSISMKMILYDINAAVR